MFTSRAEWISNALELIQNETGANGLSTALAQRVADSVTVWLSSYRPRNVSAYLDGNGTAFDYPTTGTLQTMAVPWDPELSVLRDVVYPADEQDPSPLRLGDDYRIWPNLEDPQAIRFINLTPGSGTANVRIDYTARQIIDDTVQRSDLVLVSATTVSSAGQPFTPADVGKTLTITSGTGFTTGDYTIQSVSAAGVATLSATAGTATSTGGAGTTTAMVTVPKKYQAGFEYALASRLCKVYAGKYGHTTDSTIGADAINYHNLTDTWLKLEANWLGLAGDELGVDLNPDKAGTVEPVPAGGFLDWDPTTRYGENLIRTRRQR